MNPAIARCELSDLPPDQCACRIHAKTADDDRPLPGRPFTASFGGSCPACDDRIHPGDQIQRTSEGAYIHEECQ
jgi:hypothetical protein